MTKNKRIKDLEDRVAVLECKLADLTRQAPATFPVCEGKTYEEVIDEWLNGKIAK